MRHIVVIPVLAAFAVLPLAGCSSSNEPEQSATAAAGSAASPQCTKEVLQPVVNSQADSLGRGNTMPIQDLQCSGDWAVASGNLLPKNEPATFIFQLSGETWVWQQPDAVCGKSADKSSVPPDLFNVACES